MFDYALLSDLDFEKLCADVMGRMLSTSLRYFPSGRDGGIDLVDDLTTMNIMIQVKHYEKSSYSTFKHSLKGEIPKVKKQKPKQYYIFTSQSLTPQNIQEIYAMFQDYMESERNIITREDIDQFLKKEENIDVLRSQFKLWITSDAFLTDYLNQDILFDSEVLLSDIEDELKYFVPTVIFNQSIEILESERKILLYGDPGVGKTLTSKMLLLNFIKKGYRIRYSSDNDISGLKKSLTSNQELKEVIFLDDCLGQHYFRMREGHDKELLYLIKHVERYPNKILILNSRVTILNEARNVFEELDRYFSQDKINIRKINMNDMTPVDKAKIFYSLLKRNNVSNTYYNDVRKERRYLKVVEHKNFNPRVIEYVTLPDKLKRLSVDAYFNFIMKNLQNPQSIWKNEFEKRIQSIDRLFMYTLYSLTDTHIAIEVLEEAFDYLIATEDGLDTTVYNFGAILKRLNQSVVKIVDIYGWEEIGVLNPSVNDYMRASLFENRLLLNKLRENAIYLEQLERLYDKQEFKELLKQLLIKKELFEYRPIKEGAYFDLRLSLIGEHEILDEEYIWDMTLLPNLHDFIRFGSYQINKLSTIKKYLQNSLLRDFYEVETILIQSENLEWIFEGLNFIEALKLIDAYHDSLENISSENSNYMMEYVLDEFEYFIEEFDYRLVVEGFLEKDVFGELLDPKYAVMIEEVQKEVEELVQDVKHPLIKENILNRLDVYTSDIESNLQDAFESFIEEKKKSKKKVSPIIDTTGIVDILDRTI